MTLKVVSFSSSGSPLKCPPAPVTLIFNCCSLTAVLATNQLSGTSLRHYFPGEGPLKNKLLQCCLPHFSLLLLKGLHFFSCSDWVALGVLSAGQHTAFIMVPAFLLDMESAKKAKAAKVAKLFWRFVLFRRSDRGYIIWLRVLGCHNAYVV